MRGFRFSGVPRRAGLAAPVCSFLSSKTGEPVYVSKRRFPDVASLQDKLGGEFADEIVDWMMNEEKSFLSASLQAAPKAIREASSRPYP
jgi:hypothetical protein